MANAEFPNILSKSITGLPVAVKPFLRTRSPNALDSPISKFVH